MTGYCETFNRGAYGDFIVRTLERDEIPAFLALQKKASAALPDGQKHFLKIRTQANLEAHIDAGMPLIGVFNDRNELVAQALVGFPGQNPDRVLYTEDYEPLEGHKGESAVIQCISADPDLKDQKLHLMDPILKAAESITAQAGLTQLVAKVAATNGGSLKGFRDRGYCLESFNDAACYNGTQYEAVYPVKLVGAARALVLNLAA